MPAKETPGSPAIQVIALILEWLHQPQQGTLYGLFENSVLGRDLNLSAEQISNIEVDFIQQIEEIKDIAKLLAT
jgi:hypothetical protein